MSKVAIIMGSDSDLPVMQLASETLKNFGIAYDLTIVSAHRTPERLIQYGKNAENKGFEIIIAGAGGAAHLPGMIAATSSLPVIGVPIKSSNSIDGWDSILSILQMPAGVPVATVALNGAKNAGLLAVQILSTANPKLKKKFKLYKKKIEKEVLDKVDKLKKAPLKNKSDEDVF